MTAILSDFARTLATDFPVQAILDHLVIRIAELLPVDGAGVTLISPTSDPRTVAASNEDALAFERIQSDLGDGPCTAAYESGEVVLLPDLRIETRFSAFRTAALAQGLVAVFTFPLHAGAERLGALDLYRRSAGPLDDMELTAAQTLADVAAAYLVNMRGRMDLEAAILAAQESARHEARTVRALRVSEARKSAILASIPDTVVTVDASGFVVEFNDSAERSFACSNAHAIGRTIDEFITPPEGFDHRWVAAMTSGGSERGGATAGPRELLAIRADGSTFAAEVTVSAVKGPDPRLYTAFVRDITQRNEAEAEGRILTDRVHQTERLESVGQLAGGIAHDFNNLLTVIINSASLLAEEVNDQATREYANEILAAGERASQLTNQLRMFARREPLALEPVDLSEIIADIQQLLVRTLGEGIDIVVDPTGGPLVVLADRGQIEQVLINLAVNARDAMTDGGVVTIAATPTGGPSGSLVKLVVGDNGSGMTADVVARAFEPFFTTKGPGEGGGLGLATVYGIVTDAGGSIEVQSEEGTGTNVIVHLPLTKQAPAQAETPPAHRPDHAPDAGATILLVEDRDAVRRVTTTILRAAGYLVLEAADASAALEIAKRSSFDAVLTDVVMPNTSGHELVAALRAQGLARNALFMSGFDDHDLGSPGVGEVLVRKPFTGTELLSALGSMLAKPGTIVGGPDG